MIRAENHKETLRAQMVRCAVAHSISAAARRFGTTRKTVRKWLGRQRGGEPLTDRSRRPHSSSSRIPPEFEDQLVELRTKTRCGPHRLSDSLRRTKGASLSPWTVRNILKRNGLLKRRKRRKTCYPAHWAWEADEPFSPVQADVKDVHDKGTLGTQRTT
jgi:transposase